MMKKFIAATMPVALIATSFSGVPVGVKAEEIQNDFYKGVEKDGKWVKDGLAIASFDFSEYEEALREAGENNGYQLMDVNVVAIDLDSGAEIDFGSFVDFKSESKELFEAGKIYQFSLQGVYYLTGEGVDPGSIESDYEKTGFVVVVEAPVDDGPVEPEPEPEPEEPGDNLEDSAKDAVDNAEEEMDQDAVDDARDAVDLLPEGDLKDKLNDRLDEVQKEIDGAGDGEPVEPEPEPEEPVDPKPEEPKPEPEPEEPGDDLGDSAKDAVDKAESEKDQGSVDDAKDAVDLLPEGELKDELNDRLDEVQKDIDKGALEDTAKDSVDKAESEKDQDSLDDARDSVDLLPEGELKDELNDRLDEVQKEIDAAGDGEPVEPENPEPEPEEPVDPKPEPEPEEPVDPKPEEPKPEPEPEEPGDELGDSAKDAVDKAESKKDQESVDDARDSVDSLPEGELKDELNDRLDEVQKDIDKGALEDTAKDSVDKAEKENDQDSVDDARNAVDKLPEGEFKDELNDRLDEIQKELDAVKPFYEDVEVGSVAHDDIYEATDLGIVRGYKIDNLNYFEPHSELTRAAAVVMVLRSLNIDYEGYVGEGFEDIKGTWYESAVAKAKDLGIAFGYSDTVFGGNDFVSREQLAAFMSRAYINDYQAEPNGFSDVDENGWAYDAINQMVDVGAIMGHDDGTFKPKETATRSQSVMMIMRVLRSDSPNIGLEKYKGKSLKGKLGLAEFIYTIEGDRIGDDVLKPTDTVDLGMLGNGFVKFLG